jgi:hypothetical protein
MSLSFEAFLELVWHVLVVDGWSVAWRIGIASFLFGVLGLLLLVGCFKLFYRRGLLKLDLRHDRFFEWLMVALWVIGLPFFSLASGILVGSWWAGSFLITTEHLGERLGKGCFKTIAAGIAAAHLEESEQDRLRAAHALLRGEQKLTIKEVSKFTSHHAGELTAAQLESLLPIASEGDVHNTTIWMVESCLNTIAYYQLGSEGDVIYKLVIKVTEHDRNTDNDGFVTIEEISEVACKTFLDRGVTKLWAILILEFLIPVGAVFLSLPLVPPILAWLVRRIGGWWRARKAG